MGLFKQMVEAAGDPKAKYCALWTLITKGDKSAIHALIKTSDKKRRRQAAKIAKPFRCRGEDITMCTSFASSCFATHTVLCVNELSLPWVNYQHPSFPLKAPIKAPQNAR
ncbi:hypothetical protein D3C86_1615310 [compost metagenome]